LINKSCAKYFGIRQPNKGRNIKNRKGNGQQEIVRTKNSWKDNGTPVLREIGFNQIKKKRELSGSQLASLDQIIHYGINMIVKRVSSVIIIIVHIVILAKS
jgi:hypothetical protein